jgi:DNA (cytosine-5)-methyltransferase 1
MTDVKAYMERRERCKELRKNGNGFGLTLGMAVKIWPTPTVSDTKPASSGEIKEYRSENRRTTVQRLRAAATDPDQVGGSLNPTWVEWLMGYPLGWTDLEGSATRSSRRLSKR